MTVIKSTHSCRAMARQFWLSHGGDFNPATLMANKTVYLSTVNKVGGMICRADVNTRLFANGRKVKYQILHVHFIS